MIVWSLYDAVVLVRTLAEELSPRYHAGLTGSVLLRGYSENDLDIVVYPASTADRDETFVRAALERAGLTLIHDREVVHAKWRRCGSSDEKHVEVREFGGKKVDIFFLA